MVANMGEYTLYTMLYVLVHVLDLGVVGGGGGWWVKGVVGGVKGGHPAVGGA